MVILQVPHSALRFGLVNDPIGTHGSRTMMLAELRTLLSALPPTADLEDYRAAVVQDNLLLKNTLAGRRATFRALRELYGLSPEVPIFRALRELWDADLAAQPLLALLCASSRDPILRATAGTTLAVKRGDKVTSTQFAAATAEAFPGRYSPGHLDHIGRHVASSWQQSGHLMGHQRKFRATAISSPTAVAYGLFVGYLCEERGDGLFGTLWARLLDTPLYLLREQAAVASQRGWIDYRYAGAVTDVGFSYLLRDVRIDS